MSTNDVPGAKHANNDVLAMGCWAESAEAGDQSLMFVQGLENGTVYFRVFDLAKDPLMEYSDALGEVPFKKLFSWKPEKDGVTPGGKWTWHDKTPFPWAKVIKAGSQDGYKYASVHEQLSAAARVAEHLKMRGKKVDLDD
jgi:hypothetical protein